MFDLYYSVVLLFGLLITVDLLSKLNHFNVILLRKYQVCFTLRILIVAVITTQLTGSSPCWMWFNILL